MLYQTADGENMLYQFHIYCIILIDGFLVLIIKIK
ncbi:hypothetical protein EVA_01209 [gut metagenome]|uniref:Uncharacterized protein n=1 Tax=gut metagenome TaxID=749906 RepID=J9GQ70_9ZZZZ